MKMMKRFLAVLLLMVFIMAPVRAEEDDVTDIGFASYYTTDVVRENNLRNGVRQFTHLGMVSAAEGEVTDMGMGVDEDFVPNKYYPQQVSIIDVPVTSGASLIPWAYISNSAWSLKTVGEIAKDYEIKHPGEKVIAAVNGDFYDISGSKMYPNTPNNIHASNGDIFKSVKVNNAVGFLNNGLANSMVGNKKIVRNEKPTLAIFDENDVKIKEFTIDKVNENPNEDEVAVLYPVYGVLAHQQAPKSMPIDVEEAYIVHDGEYSIPYTSVQGIFGYESDNEDFFGKGIISKYGSGTLGQNDFAIKTTNAEINKYLTNGTKIRVQYEFEGDFAGVENIIGYNQPILYDGVKAGTIKQRAPRTMVGVKEDGSYVLGVIDGRQPGKGMYGAATAEMAAILTHYGAVEAYNLDGGGSSAMAILDDETDEFVLVNTYSDSRERPVANALLVVVKNPVIEVSPVEVTSSNIKLNVNVLKDNGFKVENLYVKLNDETKQVINSEVTFANLDKQTNYRYEVLYKENNEYIRLYIYDNIKTAKEKIVLNSIMINYDGDDLIFTLDIDDVDNAFVRGVIVLDGIEADIINGKAIFRGFKGSYFESFNPIIIYDLNTYKGEMELEIENVIVNSSLDVLIDYSLNMFNNFHKKGGK